MPTRNLWSCSLLLLLPFAFCLLTAFPSGEKTVHATAVHESTLTDQQIRVLSAQKVFFGHQSVGDNIVQGIRDLMLDDPRLKLRIVESRSPETAPGPAFVEAHLGRNTDPLSKNIDFQTIIDHGFAGIALLKYCYVDIGGATDVQQMFNAYRSTINSIRRNHPSVRIVHVTVPLTTVDSSPKEWLKSVLGRNTTQDDNIKRNHFNQLLLQTYGSEPIFDLAKIESTHRDGSRSYFKKGNETIYTFAPEYTTDGGHLDNNGRQLAARGLLQALADTQ